MSYVPKEVLKEIGSKGSPLTKDMVIKRIQRLRLKQRFADLREFYASYSTKYLRQPEIDFVQGRISATVFMRNHFNPGWITDLKDRALKNAGELLNL